MLAPTPIGLGIAVAIAGTAAISDSRSGTIPNWLTLPPILLAPLAYGLAFGLGSCLQCIGAVFASGVGPYLLFRRRVMGGGDVKLFAALGAATGFDALLGVQIQLAAFAAAMLMALVVLAWKGKLLITLASAAATPLNKVLPRRFQLRVAGDLSTPVRMGGAVFTATAACALPYLLNGWSAP